MLYTDEFKQALSESIDGPHGYVIARDRKTGKILINKHNMIVQTGKEYLWAIFLSQQGANDENYDTTLPGMTLNTAVFSDNTEEVAYTDMAVSSGKRLTFSLNYENVNGTMMAPANFSQYNGHRYLFFTFSLNGSLKDASSPNSVSSLELRLGSGTAGQGTVLFSRIRFDTIPFTEDSDIELVYYIYF